MLFGGMLIYLISGGWVYHNPTDADPVVNDIRKSPTVIFDSGLPQANTKEYFGYVFLKALEGIFIDRMEQNEDITAKYLNEKDFQKVVGKKLLEQVYE
jgi:hypothetical protein